MNLYSQPGFLGTGASLLADLTLILYIVLLVPAMLIGYGYARRKRHRPEHRNVMIAITIVNWVLIISLMIVSYSNDIAPRIAEQPTVPRYLIPTLHAILGLPAQLLATYIVVRMLMEDVNVAQARRRGETGVTLQRYWFKAAKPAMRITLGLWLATAALGIVTYFVRYDVLPGGGGGGGEANPPVATPEVLPPAATQEVGAPVQTPEIDDEQEDED